jgi:hypothetical protein
METRKTMLVEKIGIWAERHRWGLMLWGFPMVVVFGVGIPMIILSIVGFLTHES